MEKIHQQPCSYYLGKILRHLDVLYEVLLDFESTFLSERRDSKEMIAKLIKGEIECEKSLIKIIIYLSKIISPQNRRRPEPKHVCLARVLFQHRQRGRVLSRSINFLILVRFATQTWKASARRVLKGWSEKSSRRTATVLSWTTSVRSSIVISP